VATVITILLLLVALAGVGTWGQARRLERIRKRALARIERERGTRVLTLIHRQELRTVFGIPVAGYIDIDDSEKMLRAIRRTPREVPIDLILHTPGGLLLPTEQIALALRNHPAKVTVLVPHYAMSGGTMIALAANEILMDENAALGPVDPQIGEFPAASILRAVEQKNRADLEDETLILADIARLAIEEIREFLRRLLPPDMAEGTANAIATALTEGRWTHDYVITCERASALGLPVRSGLPEAVYDLMELYPQPRTV